MLGPADLIGMQERAREIYVDPAVVDYAVRLVTATRRTFSAGLADLKRYISYGASPRASIALVTGARALAFLRGRDYYCRTTSASSLSTCCGTASCCRMRRWPMRSPPTRSSRR